MKKNVDQTLLEMFGYPIEPIYGTKIGDVKDISNVGAIGVRGVLKTQSFVQRVERCR